MTYLEELQDAYHGIGGVLHEVEHWSTGDLDDIQIATLRRAESVLCKVMIIEKLKGER